MLNRRKLLKRASIAATAAAASPLSPLLTRAASANSMSEIASLLDIDYGTLEYVIGSPCCWYCTDIFFVTHFQPVAIIEVIKSADNSVITGGSSSGSSFFGGTGVRERNDQVFGARIWELPDWSIDMAMSYQSCKLCGKDMAEDSGGGSSGGGSFLDDAKDYACPGSDAVNGMFMDQMNSEMPDCFPKLLYDSSVDSDWAYGCRDIGKGALSAACMGGQSTVQDMFSGMMDDEDPPCLGSWGPMYPRQMRVLHSDPRVAAAIVATRAVSVAHELGQFGYRKDFSSSKLQITYPSPQEGSKPGDDDGLDRLRDVDIEANDGNFAFVWWTRVACCKDYDEIMGMCSPEFSCD